MKRKWISLDLCRVCGKLPTLVGYGTGWVVRCECGQRVEDFHGLSKREAAAVWNYVQRTVGNNDKQGTH